RPASGPRGGRCPRTCGSPAGLAQAASRSTRRRAGICFAWALRWRRARALQWIDLVLGHSVGEEGELQIGRARGHVGQHAGPRELLEVPELGPAPRMLVAGELLAVVAEDRRVVVVGDQVVAAARRIEVIGVGELPALVGDLLERALLAQRERPQLPGL